MLEIESLYKRYKMRGPVDYAVEDVSISVKQGEFFTLLGSSGSGKSTTLRCIAGLERPDDGTIAIGGETVFSRERGINVPVHRREIGLVFQSYAIWPHMTVAQNVTFPLEATKVPRSQRRARVADALKMVGLEDFADRPATLLSGGQQQRVAFARAIVREASVVLLDEPLSNLDASMRVQMRTELRSLQQRLGTTTLYVTHDQEEAMSLSDRIAVMHSGRIVEVGTPLDLYGSPGHEFTAQFLGRGRLFDGTVAESGPNECTWLETDLGRLLVSMRKAPTGSPIKVLIRPECLSLVATESVVDDETNALRAIVRNARFLGDVFEYEIEINGRAVPVRTLTNTGRAVGDEVQATIAPTSIVVI
jgi:iron(III) transport system ATP-binding protein